MNQAHTIKRFSRLGLSMKVLRSFPYFKAKAHNGLVLCRWLEFKCYSLKDSSPYALLRWQTIWGWTEFYEICLKSDPDFLCETEFGRLTAATDMMLHGCKILARLNADASRARWKMRPKLHTMGHISQDANSSGRNPRSWWSFKDEENMGKLSRIASAVHAQKVCSRALERWCVQFFNFMESPSQ